MQMQVMFRFPIKQKSDFSVEVQIPTGNCGVPVLHGEFIELYRLDEEEIQRAQMAALRSIAILPANFTQRAVDAMQADVEERVAETEVRQENGKWTPVLVRPVEDKAK